MISGPRPDENRGSTGTVPVHLRSHSDAGTLPHWRRDRQLKYTWLHIYFWLEETYDGKSACRYRRAGSQFCTGIDRTFRPSPRTRAHTHRCRRSGMRFPRRTSDHQTPTACSRGIHLSRQL